MSDKNTNQKELQNRIVAVIGRKGSGKSTMLGERLQSGDRLVVWDPMGEHSGKKGWVPNQITSIQELQNFFRWARKKNQFAAGYLPGDELEEEVEAVAGLVYQRGNLTFGVEEVPLICSPSYLPPVLGKLIRTGRHRQVDLYWTAQRASEVSRTLTSLTDEFILFSQTEPRDLDAIAARCGNEVARKVAALGRHDFIVWDVACRRLTDGDSEDAQADRQNESVSGDRQVATGNGIHIGRREA
jgi:hypothetical protein